MHDIELAKEIHNNAGLKKLFEIAHKASSVDLMTITALVKFLQQKKKMGK